MKKIVQFVCLSLVLLACEQDETPILTHSEYLIFGDTYGFCFGECAYLYKLTDQALFEDDSITRYYPTLEELSFKEMPLPKADFRLAEDLADRFPLALLFNSDSIIGIPDAYDQGGLYLELGRNGDTHWWLLDNDLNNLPKDIQPYAAQVQQVLEALR